METIYSAYMHVCPCTLELFFAIVVSYVFYAYTLADEK